MFSFAYRRPIEALVGPEAGQVRIGTARLVIMVKREADLQHFGRIKVVVPAVAKP